MFDIATVQGELRARRRSVRIDPTLRCVTVQCVGPEDMWTVLLQLSGQRCAVAIVSVARADGADARTDANGVLRIRGQGSPRCTLEQVKAAVLRLEFGDVDRAVEIITEGPSCRFVAAVDRFMCGVYPRVMASAADRLPNV
jgi:hypothetical protein